MTPDEPSEPAVATGQSQRAPPGSVLARCALCRTEVAVEDVSVDDALGDGPAQFCADCPGEQVTDTAAPETDHEPIVPHTGQSTSIVTPDGLP